MAREALLPPARLARFTSIELFGRPAQNAVAHAADGKLVVLSAPSGGGRTTVLDRIAELYEGPILRGGGLAGLRAVPYLALSRALRLAVPGDDPVAAAEFVLAATGRSTLLLIDDVHLCDRSTLEVVALLAGQVPMVLAVADDTRPGAELAAELNRLPFAISEALPHLSDDEARTLALSTCPDADPGAVERVLRAAGGNPAALVAMIANPDAPQLRHAVAARLTEVGAEARTALCLIGLLGRPAEPELIGADLAAAAMYAGVVLERDGWLVARSNLDVAVALEILPDDDRRLLHHRLAIQVRDPGEQARHFEAAGKPEAAVQAAHIAAAMAGSARERVALLALAARLTSGPERIDACLTVALAASDCADHQLAVAMAAAAGDDDDLRVALVRTRAALAVGNATQGLAELDRSTDARPDAGMSLLLAVERARTLCLLDPLEAMTAAAEASAAANSDGDRARTGSVLGAAQLAVGADGWATTLEAAQADAQRCGLADVAFAAAANRCSGLLRYGRAEDAHSLAMACRADAVTAGATGWAVRFETIGLWVTVQVRAALADGRRTGEALLDGALPASLRREVAAHVALAQADGGDLAAALACVDSAGSQFDRAPAGADRDDLLDWCDAELDALSGYQRSARAKAGQVLGRATRWPVPAFAALTAQWAGAANVEPTDAVRVGGATIELAALALRDSDPTRATALFAEAAARWSGYSRRSALRCRLAAAVGSADADPEAAISALRVLAAELEPDDLRLLSGQVRRQRRRLGDPEVPATPPGPRGNTLSRREAEVLGAVADGATSAAIGRQLGVAPSTVETHIKSAMRKLGATTRTEAAVLAQRR
jgi:DNA-binding NarL/FixJ family response regulator